MSHFVGGLISTEDAFRRTMRIEWIRSGIIVMPAHQQDGALRKKDRLAIVVHSLPLWIPMADENQLLVFAVGKNRESFHYMTQVMRVRIYGECFRIERQREFIGDDKIRIARRNIQRAVVLKLNQNRRVFRRFIREIYADGRFHFF